VFIAVAIVADIIDVNRFRNPMRLRPIFGLRRKCPIRTRRLASGDEQERVKADLYAADAVAEPYARA